jgi:hypothetical protein
MKRAKRRVVGFAAIAATLSLALGGLAAYSRREGVVAPRPSSTPRRAALDSWSEMASSPLSARSNSVAVWTGHAMLVWGGREIRGVAIQPVADGGAYSPATNTWQRLASSPLSARSMASGVWSGHELLIWGGFDQRNKLADGAAYDPVTRAWRMLPPSPLQARYGATSVWTGSEMIVWGGSTASGGTNGAAYDPSTRRWRMLPPTPIAEGIGDPPVAWSGHEMFVFLRPPEVSEPPSPVVAAYDPALDRWRTLPRMSIGSYGYRALLWTGDTLLVLSAGIDRGANAAWTPSNNRWHILSNPPAASAQYASANAFWTGSEAILSNIAYNATSNRWHALPPSPVPFAANLAEAWTGRQLLIWGGSTQHGKTVTDHATGARFVPATAAPVREHRFLSFPAQAPAPEPVPAFAEIMGGRYDQTLPLVDPRSGRPYYAVRDRSDQIFGYFSCDFVPAAEFESSEFDLSRECADLYSAPQPERAVVSGTIDGSVRCASGDPFDTGGGVNVIEHPELVMLRKQRDFGRGNRWAICGASPSGDSRLISLRSENGGRTWTVSSTGFGMSAHHAGDTVDIALESMTTARIRLKSFVAAFDDTYETTDGGNVWKRLDS